MAKAKKTQKRRKGAALRRVPSDSVELSTDAKGTCVYTADGVECKVSAGVLDEVHIFKDKKHLYALSVNEELGYYNLDRIDADGTVACSVFMEEADVKRLHPKGLAGTPPLQLAKKAMLFL